MNWLLHSNGWDGWKGNAPDGRIPSSVADGKARRNFFPNHPKLAVGGLNFLTQKLDK